MPPELYTVAEIATFSRSTLQASDYEFVDYLDTGNLTEGIVQSLEHYTDLSKLPSRAKKTVIEGDILFSTVRPNNRHYGIVRSNCNNLVVSTGFSVIRANRSIVLPEYLYYLLTRSSTVELLQSIAEQSVSAYPSINDSDIGKLEFEIPSISNQTIVIRIIESINQKISTNRMINDNLLQTARTIFLNYQQFASINCTVADVSSDIICGKTPPTSDSDNYGGTIPFITIPDMHSQPLILKTERYLSEKGANTQPKKELPRHSICVSCIATPGLVSIVMVPSHTNQQINSIICKQGVSPFYLYLLLSSMSEKIIALGTGGSATLNLNKEEFSKMDLLVINSDSMAAINEELDSIFRMIENNTRECISLQKLRDYLLPKLMSGEIDVSSLEVSS